MSIGVIRKDLRRRAGLAARTGDDSVLQPGDSETPEQRKRRLWPDDPMARWRREQRIKAALKYRARQQMPSKEGAIDDPNDPMIFLGEPMKSSVGVIRKFDPSPFLEPSYLPVLSAYGAMGRKPIARGLAALGGAAQTVGRGAETTGRVAAKMGQMGLGAAAASVKRNLIDPKKLKKPTLKVGDWDHQGKRVQPDDERAIDYDPAMQLIDDAVRGRGASGRFQRESSLYPGVGLGPTGVIQGRGVTPVAAPSMEVGVKGRARPLPRGPTPSSPRYEWNEVRM